MVIKRRVRIIAGALVAGTVLVLASACSNSSELSAGSLKLLVHSSTNTSASAVLSGKVSHDAAGCITIGGDVIVVPSTSKLTKTTVSIPGLRPYTIGDVATVGGGVGSAPPHSPCGARAHYWWV